MENYDQLLELEKDPNKVHFVIQVDRLGSRLFPMKLEYEHYPPQTIQNDNFEMMFVRWGFSDLDMLWFVISIPKDDYAIAEQVAAETGLRIADGVPTLFSHEGEKTFPISGPTVFSLESNTKSKVYNNDQNELEKLRAGEEAECERLIKYNINRINENLRESGFTEEQIVRIWESWQKDQEHNETPNVDI